MIASMLSSSASEIEMIFESMKGKPTKEIFKVFHYVHKKQYKVDSEEGMLRYRIFKDNLKWANAKNTELGQEIYGITQFSDLTHEEFKNKVLMNNERFQKHINEFRSKSNNNNKSFLSGESQKSLSFDLMADEDDRQDQNIKSNSYSSAAGEDSVNWIPKMNPARNQGNCGSCWAFAATATIEGQYNIKFSQLLDLSEQYLVDCDDLDGGCEGGWPSNTYSWIMKNGIVDEKTSPYFAERNVCNLKKFKNRQYNIVKNFTEYSNETQPVGNWYDLLNKGPILVAMDAGDRGFGMYKPKKDSDQIWNPQTCGELNHAVVAVGYKVVNATTYLIVRNSWGTDWGVNGYFYVNAKNACGILTYAWLPDVYNGTVPDPNPQPEPEPNPKPNPDPEPEPQPKPVNNDNCLQMYSECNFMGNLSNACNSVNYLKKKISSLKVATNTSQIEEVVAFKNADCLGKPVIFSSENKCLVDKSFKQFYPKSLALNYKNNHKCVKFFSSPCLGNEPSYTICGSVADLKDDYLGDTESIDFDSANVNFVTFFEEPNFLGNAYSVSAKQMIYNIKTHQQLIQYLENARSVLFG